MRLVPGFVGEEVTNDTPVLIVSCLPFLYFVYSCHVFMLSAMILMVHVDGTDPTNLKFHKHHNKT